MDTSFAEPSTIENRFHVQSFLNGRNLLHSISITDDLAYCTSASWPNNLSLTIFLMVEKRTAISGAWFQEQSRRST